MKVTKLIREYVEEEVCKVYESKQNPYSEQANADRKKIEDFKELLINSQQKLIDDFIATTPLFRVYGKDEVAKIGTSIPSFYHLLTQAMIDEEEWNRENSRLKQAKIREIILNLELGANREELKAMIAELIKEGTEDNT